jgi:hypothetical protein
VNGVVGKTVGRYEYFHSACEKHSKVQVTLAVVFQSAFFTPKCLWQISQARKATLFL